MSSASQESILGNPLSMLRSLSKTPAPRVNPRWISLKPGLFRLLSWRHLVAMSGTTLTLVGSQYSEPELIEPDLPCASDGKWIYSFKYSPLSISTPTFFKTY